jgi:recombination protein RecR
MIESLRVLPGVGQKTAARFAFFLLRSPKEIREKLGTSLLDVEKNLQKCEECGHFSEEVLCNICKDQYRVKTQICVVEDSLDLVAIERAAQYRGIYHVLGGALSPLDGIGPEDIRIEELIKRIQTHSVTELIMATNPTLEGEATAALLQRKCEIFPELNITKLARGIPIGGDVEYADEITLARALENRIAY